VKLREEARRHRGNPDAHRPRGKRG
jgi:hypothetical protein